MSSQKDLEDEQMKNNNFFATSNNNGSNNNNNELHNHQDLHKNTSQDELPLEKLQSNQIQQFEDFNDNTNEMLPSEPNIQQKGSLSKTPVNNGNNGFLSLEENDNEMDSNIKSNFKQETELLNLKKQQQTIDKTAAISKDSDILNDAPPMRGKNQVPFEDDDEVAPINQNQTVEQPKQAHHKKKQNNRVSSPQYDESAGLTQNEQPSNDPPPEESERFRNSKQNSHHLPALKGQVAVPPNENVNSKQRGNNNISNNNFPLNSYQEFQSYSNPDSHHRLKQSVLEPLPNFLASKTNGVNGMNNNNNTTTIEKTAAKQLPEIKQTSVPQTFSKEEEKKFAELDKPPQKHVEKKAPEVKDLKKKENGTEDEEDQPKQALDPKYDDPQAPFTISRNQLVLLASAGQQRHFAEEVDYLEKMGGIPALQSGLITDTKKGLSNTDEDFGIRDTAFGNNLQEISVPKGFIELFCDALEDFTMRVLLVAAVFSIIIEVATAESDKRSTSWIEGFAILVAVFVCATVTSVNDYQKERQFQQLNNEADKRKIITIIRAGQKENKHQSLVMVGDLVDLVEGMEIPADGIVLEASELTADESAMTGETDPMKKNTLSECIKRRDDLIQQGLKNSSGTHDVPSPLLLSGTKVLTGQGKMLIIVVGEFSCVGKISKLLNTKEEEVTPLQEKLEAIAMDIGGFGLKSAILIVLVLFIRFAIEKIYLNEWDHSKDWSEMLRFIIIGITVVVVAIPEGLPLSVTLSLAYSVKKMLKDNNLVRKLQACETMGGADCICSDKTGTLTQNKMTLTTWWNEEIQDFNKYDSTDDISNYIPANQPHFKKLFLQSCAINCSADLRPDEKGSKTEVAVLRLIEKFNEKYEDWREEFQPELFFPFSSARKRMSIVINSEGKRVMLVKGASEMVLASCNKFLSKQTGQERPIDEQLLGTMKAAIKSMADNALRTIVLAYKVISDRDDMVTKDHLGVFDVETKGLTCLAIFGIKDILRAEVPDAVKQCQDAGIKVRMVTGDNKDTARAIARDCNILSKSKTPSPYQVIEGIEFIKLTGGIVCKTCQTAECDCLRDQQQATKEGKSFRVDTIKNGDVFDKIYQEIDVMARSRPEDKYAMVVGLIERKHVVAVTGDGTNDAPALKKADVGFAMGIAGTEVARGAAAIILLDDNFKSIVSAVLWGRNIYDSIKKFLQFQLTVNIVAVGITLIGAAVIKQDVLQAIQMLWINLIMDTFASLALATEPPHQELLLRKPHNRDEYIVSKKMFKHIIGQAIYQLVIMIILVFDGENFLPEVYDSFDDEIIGNTLFDKPWKAKYSDEKLTKVCSGRLKSMSGMDDEYQLVLDEYNQPSRHFTVVFNAFVWMQIFNFLNARKLQDEINIFEGLSKNFLFLVMVALIAGLQALLIQVGSIPFSCYKNGLNAGNWGISIAFGSGSILMGFLLKFISEDKCAQAGTKRVNPLNNNSRVLSLKGNRGDGSSMSRRYSLVQHPVLNN